MHIVQRRILKELALHRNLNFSDLRSPSVDSNRHAYHVKCLLQGGFIRLDSKGYNLTSSGRRFADRMSLPTLVDRIQPKIVTLLVCKRGEDFLLYKRGREPFIGKIGFPYGKIHMGENIASAAARELQEKTGVTAELVHRGDVYILVLEKDEIITHMLCHVFSGTYEIGEPIASEIGRCFWARPEDISKKEFMPGFQEIGRLLKRRGRSLFFEEMTFDISK
ncbi:MAG: NUDIX domain-containing protein [Patescibacteria group bacterium]